MVAELHTYVVAVCRLSWQRGAASDPTVSEGGGLTQDNTHVWVIVGDAALPDLPAMHFAYALWPRYESDGYDCAGIRQERSFASDKDGVRMRVVRGA